MFTSGLRSGKTLLKVLKKDANMRSLTYLLAIGLCSTVLSAPYEGNGNPGEIGVLGQGTQGQGQNTYYQQGGNQADGSEYTQQMSSESHNQQYVNQAGDAVNTQEQGSHGQEQTNQQNVNQAQDAVNTQEQGSHGQEQTNHVNQAEGVVNQGQDRQGYQQSAIGDTQGQQLGQDTGNAANVEGPPNQPPVDAAQPGQNPDPNTQSNNEPSNPINETPDLTNRPDIAEGGNMEQREEEDFEDTGNNYGDEVDDNDDDVDNDGDYDEDEDKDYDVTKDSEDGDSDEYSDDDEDYDYESEENDEDGKDNSREAAPQKPTVINPDLQAKSRGHGVSRDEEVDGSSHFITFFCVAAFFAITGYLLYHNKQKVMGMIVEGRSKRQAGSRPSTKDYTQLSSNIEEVITSNEKQGFPEKKPIIF